MRNPSLFEHRAHRAVIGRIFKRIVCVSLLACAAAAWAAPSGPPPLIDRQLFFGDPEIAGAQISPDGKFIAFLKPLDGTRNVWVKGTQDPFASAHPVTAETKRPIAGYFWSRDGKFILFAKDQGGDENYNVFAVDPAASPASGQRVPAARNLTEAKGVRAAIYEVPKTDPDTIYVGLNDRDPSWHDLYKVRISTGERTLLRKNTERLTGWVFDRTGQLRLATRSAENGDTEVLRVDPDGFKKVYSCGVFETCYPARFHKDGQHVYMVTNKGDVDLTRLELFDPAAGSEELVEADPLSRVDFEDPLFSERTDELIATSYFDDKLRIYWKDKDFEADYDLLRKRLPGKEVHFRSGTRDERLFLVSAASDTEPGESYLFDRASKKLTLQYRIYDKLPRQHLAAMKPVRYKSSDGLEIPAYLTLPKGVPAKGLPLLVLPHGGPWGRDTWGYDPFSQFLANRGYAVLQPNFRASTGYGKKFLNAGNNEWGQKMQDDLTWGVKYLVAEGVADPKRVGIIGASYGGYATLAGLTFTPDVYAAGVSIVGPSNLITLLDSIPPYWESIRKIFAERMGNPATPEGRAQLERQSPLNSAAKIKAPLLVVQGANDPRVNKGESDRIVIALRDRGFPVEYLVAPDEGHGFARPVNNMAMFAAAEKFLARHLGGRAQESMTPEVATRLQEITVDPKTVVEPKRVAASAVTTPKPASDLKPGTASYKASIEVGGQTIPMSLTREVKEEGGSWAVTETAKTAMGDITDKTVLEKGTLIPTGRSIHQGPVIVELQLKDGKATGTMTVNGQAKPVEADLGGPLFADGAGAHLVLAALPLAEGYTATYRNFDVQAQKVKLVQVKVAGAEKVTVPAGTFDSLKLEVTSADGGAEKTTVWIDPATRQVLKTVSVVPQMNGAVITSELTP
jgi:dipeptidyl aminopeptidase/acylaminoacyl peptidase